MQLKLLRHHTLIYQTLKEKDRMSKFIISGFSDEIAPSLDIQLKEIVKMGMEYIEIRGVDGKNIIEYSLDEVRKIKKQLDDVGIRVSALGSPIGKIQISDDFTSHFHLFKHAVDVAKILETKYIRIFSFFMEEGTAKAHREEVLKRMKAFCDYVQGSGIILLHENEKGIYGDTPERCIDLYQMMASDDFKLIFDPANYVQSGVETYPYAYEALKDYVIYYHIKDALKKSGKVVPSGLGDANVPNIIKALYEKDYEGFLSLEPHLGHFEGFENLEGDREGLKFEDKSDISKFRLALDSLLKILEEVKNG